MTASFAQRRIEASFILEAGKTFVETGKDTVSVSGLRAAADIQKTGDNLGATLRIWGVPNSLMNQLSTLGMRNQIIPKNSMLIKAGDSQDGMALIFSGNVMQAWADYSGQPDVMLLVTAQALLFETIAPATPSTYRGTVDVANIMQDLATKAGFGFENEGVSVMLSNPYFEGTVGQQIDTAAEHAGINHTTEPAGIGQKLVIWPKDKPRRGGIPVISKDTGLVGYPTYTSQGVAFRTLYNPNLVFHGQVKLQSEAVRNANGTWEITSINHVLETELPGGAWFTDVEATASGVVRG